MRINYSFFQDAALTPWKLKRGSQCGDVTLRVLVANLSENAANFSSDAIIEGLNTFSGEGLSSATEARL